MSVNTVHPEYSTSYQRWLTIREVIDNDAKCHIRTLDPLDKTRQNTLRNERYRADAVLINFTALTQQGLAGLIFRKPPQVRLPRQVDYLRTEAAEDGRDLKQLSRDLIVEMITLGRAGLLVDFPRSEGDLDTLDNDLKAKISLYKSEDIKNWNTARINGKLQLTLVVLEENRDALQSDGFSWKKEKQYRVLKLEPESEGSKSYIYNQYLYSENGEIQVTTPRDFNGNLWTEIPFIFAGAENNNPHVDKSPLYDIALLNIAHYKNSADLEESGHVVGQPTLIVKAAMDPEDFAKANPNGLKLGCRAAYNVGAEGDAKFLQVNPNQLIAEMMKQKEHQAAFIGARLIAPAGGRETAEAARMRFGSSNSALSHLVDNADMAMSQVIKWVCKYQDGNPNLVKYNLNNKFFDDNIDPQVIMQGIMLVNEEIIPRSVVQDYARDVGFVKDDKTNEELDKEIEKTSQLNRDLLEDDNGEEGQDGDNDQGQID